MSSAVESRPLRSGSRRGRSAGQGLVEFALVLPVFLLILFGLIDVGRFVYMNSTLSQAAREGARLGATEASWIGSSDPACNAEFGPVCPADTAALEAHVTAAANRMMAPFGAVDQVHVQCDAEGSAPTGSWTGTDCPAASRQPGDVVSVRVELQFAPLLGIIAPITTSGSASMVIN
jgi:hypothetical protein